MIKQDFLLQKLRHGGAFCFPATLFTKKKNIFVTQTDNELFNDN